jgi:hypothetical protein
VRLEIKDIHICDGEALRAEYGSLSDEVPAGVGARIDTPTAAAQLVAQYEAATAAAFGNNAGTVSQGAADVPFVQAFLAAARGFTDGMPVHYPRESVARDPEGNNFKWFVANDKPQHRTVLPALATQPGEAAITEPGLPFLGQPKY